MAYLVPVISPSSPPVEDEKQWCEADLLSISASSHFDILQLEIRLIWYHGDACSANQKARCLCDPHTRLSTHHFFHLISFSHPCLHMSINMQLCCYCQLGAAAGKLWSCFQCWYVPHYQHGRCTSQWDRDYYCPWMLTSSSEMKKREARTEEKTGT